MQQFDAFRRIALIQSKQSAKSGNIVVPNVSVFRKAVLGDRLLESGACLESPASARAKAGSVLRVASFGLHKCGCRTSLGGGRMSEEAFPHCRPCLETGHDPLQLSCLLRHLHRAPRRGPRLLQAAGISQCEGLLVRDCVLGSGNALWPGPRSECISAASLFRTLSGSGRPYSRGFQSCVRRPEPMCSPRQECEG